MDKFTERLDDMLDLMGKAIEVEKLYSRFSERMRRPLAEAPKNVCDDKWRYERMVDAVAMADNYPCGISGSTIQYLYDDLYLTKERLAALHCFWMLYGPYPCHGFLTVEECVELGNFFDFDDSE